MSDQILKRTKERLRLCQLRKDRLFTQYCILKEVVEAIAKDIYVDNPVEAAKHALADAENVPNIE